MFNFKDLKPVTTLTNFIQGTHVPEFLSTRAARMPENEVVKKIMVKRQNQARASSNPNAENQNTQNLPNINPEAKGSKIRVKRRMRSNEAFDAPD